LRCRIATVDYSLSGPPFQVADLPTPGASHEASARGWGYHGPKRRAERRGPSCIPLPRRSVGPSPSAQWPATPRGHAMEECAGTSRQHSRARCTPIATPRGHVAVPVPRQPLLRSEYRAHSHPPRRPQWTPGSPGVGGTVKIRCAGSDAASDGSPIPTALPAASLAAWRFAGEYGVVKGHSSSLPIPILLETHPPCKRFRSVIYFTMI